MHESYGSVDSIGERKDTVLNDLDRFHLVMDTIDRLPGPGADLQRLE